MNHHLTLTPAATGGRATIVTDRHFGVNLLFDRDRDTTGLAPTAVSAPFDAAVNALGATALRYPGGTIAEQLFDIASPDGAAQDWLTGTAAALFDPGRGASTGTLGLAEALDHAAWRGLDMTMVVPTYRFLGNAVDANGHRHEAVDARLVAGFVTRLLSEATARGVSIDVIELGNEWWVDNSALFGSQMTAVEYGRIASRLAAVVQQAIDAFRAALPDPAAFDEPAIVAQVGPGGRAEYRSSTGHPVAAGHSGPVVTATELIFREFDRPGERQALDGLVTHRYLKGAETGIDGWAYAPFDTFDRLADAAGGFGPLSRHVTEWNVAARNEDLQGLRQAGLIVSLLAEQLAAGVAQSSIWAVQQNNGTRLANTAGFAHETYDGLSFAGAAFRLLSHGVKGLSLRPQDDGSAAIDSHVFAAAGKTVVFLSNRTDDAQTVSLTPGTVAPGAHHAWTTRLGAGEAGSAARTGRPDITVDAASEGLAGQGLSYRLAPWEVLRLDLATGSAGAAIEGTDGSERLVGSSWADRVKGGAGADTILGGAGDDTLIGGTGDNRIDGGAGADRINGIARNNDLRGDAGSDTIMGGSGHDTIDGGAGDDEIRGLDGDDFLFGRVGEDTIIGNAGNDTIGGGAQSDLIFGGAGDDLLNGGYGHDRLNGGAGADGFIHSGDPGHGTDWIQDFSSAEGDRLVFAGAAAGRGQFQVNIAHTAGAGSDALAEAFVISRATGQVLWALVDGAALPGITLQSGDALFDLLA